MHSNLALLVSVCPSWGYDCERFTEMAPACFLSTSPSPSPCGQCSLLLVSRVSTKKKENLFSNTKDIFSVSVVFILRHFCYFCFNEQLYSLNPWVKDAISPCWIKHTLKLIQSILMTQVDYSMECRITLTWSTIPLEKYKSLDFKKGLSLYTISYSSKTLIWWK